MIDREGTDGRRKQSGGRTSDPFASFQFVVLIAFGLGQILTGSRVRKNSFVFDLY
jgi:hypothetical protein